MYKHKDLLGLKDLSREEIEFILETAMSMEGRIDSPGQRPAVAGAHSAVTLFYENSTRTRMSFALAGEYLGMSVSDLGVSASSVQKGERLADTGRTLDAMGVSVMVIRHGQTGAAHLLAGGVRAAVINAGDGCNEHPTQALLDMYTILRRKGRLDGLKVAIIGDISHSRVARSNLFGLTAFGSRVALAGPPTLVSKKLETLREGVTVTSDIKEAVRDADVVMGLRIQLERQKAASFPDLREYAALYGLNAAVLSLAKPDALIMHPGPVNRGVEMTTDLIDHSRSVIQQQVRSGVAVRMALLSILSGAANN